MLRAVRTLDPAAFAFVMATGIVSEAMHLRGLTVVSEALLAIAGAAFVVLAVASVWRLVAFRDEALADAQDPAKAFGYLTTVAASGVLASRLTVDGRMAVAEILVGVAMVTWLVLSYLVPAAVTLHRADRPALGGISGSWFMWVVSAQSIAVSSADLARLTRHTRALTLVALGTWSVGVVLYLLVAALVMVALLHRPVEVAHLSPTHWIFMGATAITVLAGARILEVADVPPFAVLAPVVAGLSFVLWAFGSWFVPLLVIAGVWRHLRRERRVTYEVGLWSVVFPLGMYAVATTAFGAVTGLPALADIGKVASWVALGVWTVVTADLVAVLLGFGGVPSPRPRRPPELPTPSP